MAASRKRRFLKGALQDRSVGPPKYFPEPAYRRKQISPLNIFAKDLFLGRPFEKSGKRHEIRSLAGYFIVAGAAISIAIAIPAGIAADSWADASYAGLDRKYANSSSVAPHNMAYVNYTSHIASIKYTPGKETPYLIKKGISKKFTPRYGLEEAVPVYGVTLDSLENIDDIVSSLQSLPKRPTTRIVFDYSKEPDYYVKSVKRISSVSDVMGGILDSTQMKYVSPEEYLNRTEKYLSAMGDNVSIWEVGNEVSGDYVGPSDDVRSKMFAAYNVSKKHHKKTALTIHYNPCYCKTPEYEMFNWTEKYVPTEMKLGLDYVLISFYEKNCPNADPDWNDIFDKLSDIFPKSRIGFGEIGTDGNDSEKAALIEKYYGMNISNPSYVGGCFWWYYHSDMVPYTKPLWEVLNQSISGKQSNRDYEALSEA